MDRHRQSDKPQSVKLKVDTREFEVHLCGRKKNSVTIHIFRPGEVVECEPDVRPAWEPGRGRT
ncbi:MAG TPA: hypothetical protein VGB98_24350 [Pyrinomonadaceae bacterium]|jgi:hypothetical protein